MSNLTVINKLMVISNDKIDFLTKTRQFTATQDQMTIEDLIVDNFTYNTSHMAVRDGQWKSAENQEIWMKNNICNWESQWDASDKREKLAHPNQHRNPENQEETYTYSR